ncbi:MAG: thioesterase family protein [Acidimicrobiales bacterium]
MSPRPGLTGTAELQVTEDVTAIAVGSGDVPVLATPNVVALVEQASVRAVDGSLGEGETTVGVRVQIDHLAPTAVGHRVRASAKLSKVEGRRLIFKVSVSDDRGLIAAGSVTRVVVDRQRFLEKCGEFGSP